MYGGNYDTFMRTKMELDESQMKQYQWEQDQIAHMKVNTHLGIGSTYLRVFLKITKWIYFIQNLDAF